MDEIKILGLTFDSKLNWISHIKKLKDECSRRINILKILSAKGWGTDQRILINTYKSIIQAKLDYGCVAYDSASNSTLKILDPILNTCLRIATHAYRTSPTSSLLTEGKVKPLALRRKQLTLNYGLKTLSLTESPVYNILKDYATVNNNNKKANKLSTKHRFHQHILDTKIYIPRILVHEEKIFYPWYNNFQENFINTEEYTTNTEENLTKFYPNYNQIYTATTSDTESSGCAILISENQQMMYKIPTWYSTETCKAITLIKAIEYAKETNKKCIIFTDFSFK